MVIHLSVAPQTKANRLGRSLTVKNKKKSKSTNKGTSAKNFPAQRQNILKNQIVQ